MEQIGWGGEPPSRWACTADRLFDGEQVRPGHALLIEADRITAVLAMAELPVGIPTLSAPGATILPGLIDTHVHFTTWQGPLYLAYGVTTVRDTGNDPDWILARRAEAPAHPWPHIACVGPMLDGPNPIWEFCRSCADGEHARRAVAETAALGVDGVKLYPGLPSAWMPAMVAEARRAGVPVMAHTSDAMGALDAGVEETFHLDGLLDAVWPGHPPGWLEVWGHPEFPLDGPHFRGAARRIADSGAITTPTLFYWEFAWQARAGQTPPAEAQYIPPQVLEWLRRFPGHGADPGAAETWRRALRHAQEFVSLLVELGAPLLTGTDEPWGLLPPGRSLWREMALLAECGMPALAVLRAATAGAASRLGPPGHGRLLPGHAADLVLVQGDPTQAIPACPEVLATVRGGRVFRPAELAARSRRHAQGLESEPIARTFARLAG